jgi:hypothetical protein
MSISATIATLALLTSQTPDLKRFVYPLAKPLKCPEIVLVTTEFPEAKEWAIAAKALVEEWYGKLTQLLATDGVDPLTGKKDGKEFRAPKVLKLEFKPNIGPPAYATGDTITVKGEWITAHPDDLGMMIHELTHVIQQYPDSPFKPGWLVEGIADYIRWWRYEPELHSTSGRTKIDFTKAKYTDAYRTTGMWLAWSSRKYNMALVPALDHALRGAKDPMPVFKLATGKSADELWGEFSKQSG